MSFAGFGGLGDQIHFPFQSIASLGRTVEDLKPRPSTKLGRASWVYRNADHNAHVSRASQR